ncbi:MAG: cysteine desulfurase family protein [Chloroflexota bacterium]
MTEPFVYLDHAATSPPPDAVRAAVAHALADGWGNPSSVHAAGRRARAAIDDAHDALAALLGTDARTLVLTSGGTEAINLAIKGAAWAGKGTGHRIVLTGVEHKAVLDACAHLERYGFAVSTVPVDADGRPDPDALVDALDARTVLVCLQLANNEIGTIVPVAELAAGIRRAAPLARIHVDAVQALPWLTLEVAGLDVDLVSVSGHKIGAPAGTGALWIRPGVAIVPQQHGGAQERYRRAGTENVPGAAGLAAAAAQLRSGRGAAAERARAARDHLAAAILRVPGVRRTGPVADRLPNHLSVVADAVLGHEVVIACDLAGVAISTGSACQSASDAPSHVLTAIGLDAVSARGALRISVGPDPSPAGIERAAAAIPAAIAHVRAGRTTLAAAGAQRGG